MYACFIPTRLHKLDDSQVDDWTPKEVSRSYNMAMEFKTIIGTESSAAPRSRRLQDYQFMFLTPCQNSTVIDIINYICVLICSDEHSYCCILSPHSRSLATVHEHTRSSVNSCIQQITCLYDCLHAIAIACS